jgi:hypothetical protein
MATRDGGHTITVARVLDVGLDAKEGERQRDHHQEYLDDLLVVAYGVKHADSQDTDDGGKPLL